MISWPHCFGTYGEAAHHGRMGQRSPLISWWLGSIERGRGRTGLSKCLLRISPIRPRLSEVQAHPTSTMTWGTKLMTRTCHGGMPKGPRVMESEVSPAPYVNSRDARLHIRSVSSLQSQESRGHLGPFSPCPSALPTQRPPASSLSIGSSYTPASSPARTSCRGSSPSPFLLSHLLCRRNQQV